MTHRFVVTFTGIPDGVTVMVPRKEPKLIAGVGDDCSYGCGIIRHHVKRDGGDEWCHRRGRVKIWAQSFYQRLV